MEDIYLRITLHDNDFHRELGEVCEFLSLHLPDSKLLADWRWTYHNETDDILNYKINQAIRSKIIDMLCVFYDFNHALDMCVPEMSMRNYFNKKLDIMVFAKDYISNSYDYEDFFICLICSIIFKRKGESNL